MYSQISTPNEEQLIRQQTSRMQLIPSSHRFSRFNDLWEETSKVTNGNG